MHVIYERSFVKSLLIVCILLQMARSSRSAIEMFAVKVDRLPKFVLDDNGNDNYVPKEDFMGEWTAMPEKIGDGLSAYASPTSWKQDRTSQSSGFK